MPDNEKKKLTRSDYKNMIGPLQREIFKNLVTARESSGNRSNLGVTNNHGYVGIYQTGAQSLEDAGFIKSGVYDAQKSKGNKAILENPDNWVKGYTYDAYLNSRDLQELAMDRIIDKNIGYIAETLSKNDIDDPVEVMSYLMASHLKGHGGAKKLINDGVSTTDAYGTSTSDYYNFAKNNFGKAAEATRKGIALQYNDKTGEAIMNPDNIDPNIVNKMGELYKPTDPPTSLEVLSGRSVNPFQKSTQSYRSIAQDTFNPAAIDYGLFKRGGVEEAQDSQSSIEDYDSASRGLELGEGSYYGIGNPAVDRVNMDLASADGKPNMARLGGLQLTNMLELGGEINNKQDPNMILNEFNEGGSHEENPYGGVPQGVGSNGRMNTVEEGETKMGSYVFSDTLRVTSNDAESLQLPKSLVNKTFAEASKYLNDILEDSPFDNITKNTITKQLDSLTLANEKAREIEELDSQPNMDLEMMSDPNMSVGGEDVLNSPEMAYEEGTQDPNMFDGGGALGEGGFELTNEGVTGAATGIATGLTQATDLLSESNEGGDTFGGVAKGALSMAATGAQIGSVIPGGAVIGAGVGALAGGVMSAIGGGKARAAARRREFNKAMNFKNSLVNTYRLGGYDDDEFNNYNMTNPINDPYGIGSNKNSRTAHGWMDNIPKLPAQEPIVDYKPLGLNDSGSSKRIGLSSVADLVDENGTIKKELVPGPNKGQFGKGAHPLQYTNLLGAGYNLYDAMNTKPEIERYQRSEKRFQPRYMDEASLMNEARGGLNTQLNSISNASGGSGAASRAGILASGLSYNRGISDAMFKARSYNQSQEANAEAANYGVDQFNISQDTRERDVNSANRAAVRNYQRDARAALFDSITGVGKELTYDRRLRRLTGGYDNSSYDPEDNHTLLEYLGLIK